MQNDLGLFDMLGNVFEWCQNPHTTGINPLNDEINTSENVSENSRILRGGSFIYRPADIRSADRNRNAPGGRSVSYGFRPSRTYH